MPQDDGRVGVEGQSDMQTHAADSAASVIPEVGGTFRMWSDYRMALEGHASNVQAGTLLAPALDAARTVADSFRRRWASGGQYPELVPAQVRLVERGEANNDEPPCLPPDGDGGERGVRNAAGLPPADPGTPDGGVETVTASDVAGKSGGTERRRRKHVVEDGSQAGLVEGARPMEEDGSKGDVVNAEEGKDAEGGGRGGGELPQQQQQQVSHGGLRRVFSRLDGLDSGMLVERALEDLHGGEERHSKLPSLSEPEYVVDDGAGGRPGRLGSIRSDKHLDAEDIPADVAVAASTAATAAELGSLSATLGTSTRDSLTAVAMSADPDYEDAVVGAENAASSERGAMQTPTADKFMLPGWHYLALSGRSLSMDFQWSNMDLVLLQDPNALQGRETGKNVLVLRSSGALTVRSSGMGESIDAQLEGASLLPCFYAEGVDGAAAAEEDANADATTMATTPRSRNKTSEEESFSDCGAARRLCLLLGGGHRASTVVGRTWLGQGVVAASSRPLLEPFMVQVGYGTVVAQATGEGRTTGTTDGRRLLSVHDSANGAVQADIRDGEGKEDVDSENEEDGEEGAGAGAGAAGVDQPTSEEMVAGVFRVAVSELQLLVAQARLKGPATIEVEVRIAAAPDFVVFLCGLYRYVTVPW